MPGIGVAKLKAGLSGYLKRVEAGEEIVITAHGRPIARLAPLAGPGASVDASLERMEPAGLIRRGTGLLPHDFWDDMPADPDGKTLAALLEERERGW